jgi:hypothetical protein
MNVITKMEKDSIVTHLRKHKINVDEGQKEIELAPERISGPGIKLWGFIDFLVNKCGYRWHRAAY